MEKIAILYGPQGGSTERVARMVSEFLGAENTVLMPVRDLQEQDLEPFSRIIFGGPTVGTHTWSDVNQRNDWDLFLTRLYKMNLSGKKCAIFGLGDQVSYSFKFVDDIGTIADNLEKTGAILVGRVGPEGYAFDESRAFRNGTFLGLPLDEDNEPEKTPDRISAWVQQLKLEFE
jgi:flavodoxin I